MLKKLKLFILLLLISFCLTPHVVKAEQTELFSMDAQQDIIVVFTYDKEEPELALVAPDGTMYAEDTSFANVERESGSIAYYITQAMEGSWGLIYDKKGNTRLDFSVQYWDAVLIIENVVIEGTADNYLQISADITSEKKQYYDYYIYALKRDSDSTITAKKELKKGSANSNNKLNVSVPTESLGDGEYYIQLEACLTTDRETEVSTFYTSEKSFSVKGNTIEQSAEGLISILDLDDSVLYLDWSGIEEYVSDWLVSVYTLNPDEPLLYESLESDMMETSFVVDPAQGDFSVRLIGHRKNDREISITKNISWKPGVTVEFSTPENTNSTKGSIHYDTQNKTVTTFLTINGEQQQLQLKGDETLVFDLESMEVNEISIRFSESDTHYYQISQRMSVDDIPAQLNIFGVNDTVNTKEQSIPIAGSTEIGASLTVNGIPYEVDASGCFVVELELKKGENTFVFEVTDLGGNKTTRQIAAIYDPSGEAATERENKAQMKWAVLLTLVYALLSLLLMGAFGTLSRRKCRKEGTEKGAYLRCLLAVLEGLCVSTLLMGGALGGLFWYLYTLYTREISGSNLQEAIKKYSLEELAVIAEKGIAFRNYVFAAGVIAGAGLMILVLLLLLGGGLRKSTKSDD